MPDITILLYDFKVDLDSHIQEQNINYEGIADFLGTSQTSYNFLNIYTNNVSHTHLTQRRVNLSSYLRTPLM